MTRFAYFLAFCLAFFPLKVCFSAEQARSFSCTLLTFPDTGVTALHFDFYVNQDKTYVIACQSANNPRYVMLTSFYCNQVFSFIINKGTVPFRRVGAQSKAIIIPRTSDKTITITSFCTASPTSNI